MTTCHYLNNLGYGDIRPTHELTKCLSVYEVLAGILLAVVALALYLGNLEKRKP